MTYNFIEPKQKQKLIRNLQIIAKGEFEISIKTQEIKQQ